MASNVVTVTLVGDAKQLQGTFRETEASARSWSDKMGSAGRSLTTGLTLPIVAGATLAIKAASDEQVEMELLANALRNNIPGATDEAIAANEDWITSMQNATGVADSDLRNAIQQLVQAGVPLEEAQRQTALAMDIAAAKGVDLGTVTNALVKANNGATGSLGKMGLATTDAAGEALTLDEILQGAADTMGGAAATAADTAAGRAQIMQARIGDLTETIGAQLLPILEKVVGWLTQVVTWFQDMDPAAQKVVMVLVGIAAAVGPVLIIGAKLVKAFSVIKSAFAGLSLAMSINPFVLLIAAVVALVVIIVMNWDKIVAFLKKTWDWIKATAGAVWDAVKKAVKAAVDFLVQLFLNWTLPGLILKHWDKIKAGVLALKDFFVTTWNNIIGFFQGLPARIGNAVAGLFTGVKNAFRNAINWVIDKWNGFRLQIKLPTLLGGATITLDTPNIPRFHAGGTFRAGTPGGEGLALLRDRETVLPPGASGGGAPVNITIYAGLGTDPNVLSKAVFEALQRYQRINGPLPLDVRLA